MRNSDIMTRNLSMSLEGRILLLKQYLNHKVNGGCTEIIVKCVIVDQFRSLLISFNQMPKNLCQWKVLKGITFLVSLESSHSLSQ